MKNRIRSEGQGDHFQIFGNVNTTMRTAIIFVMSLLGVSYPTMVEKCLFVNENAFAVATILQESIYFLRMSQYDGVLC